MSDVVSRDQLGNLAGRELGPSAWLTIDQDRIDRFADVTEDHQYIHVDVDLAATGPFGTTIAHGFLTLSLLTRMMSEVMLTVEGTTVTINYGFDRIRFLAPVPVGSEIRATAAVLEAIERKAGQILLRYDLTVEIRGEDTPALKAEWLALHVLG